MQDLAVRCLWIGLGCRRGTSLKTLIDAIANVTQKYEINLAAIAGLATLDTKVHEAGLLALSRNQQWPLHYFTAQELHYCSVPHPSGVVAAATGTPSVAEAAALTAAALSGDSAPILWVPKQVLAGVTLAIAQANVTHCPPH